MPPRKTRNAPSGAPKSGSPVTARVTPDVDAVAALTPPCGAPVAFCPAAPPPAAPPPAAPPPAAPPPVVVGALTLAPVLGALPVVGALVLLLGAD